MVTTKTRTILLRIVRAKDNSKILLYRMIDFPKFINLLTSGIQITIINTRLGRVAKRLIERPKMALHPVAFFL